MPGSSGTAKLKLTAIGVKTSDLNADQERIVGFRRQKSIFKGLLLT